MGGLMNLFRENDHTIFFAYFKVVCEDDHSAVQDKFICIKHSPSNTPIMIRAQSGTYDNQIQRMMPHHLKLNTDCGDFEKMLSIDNIQKHLMRNMGSDKATKLDFGGGHVWNVRMKQLEGQN